MDQQNKDRIQKFFGPFASPLYMCYLLVDDFKSWRSFPKWFWSFRPGYSLLHEATPWISFEAAKWLQSYIRKNMKVFEYGSGGSTIFLAERAGRVFSVEHDKHWYTLVSRVLEQRGLTNCTYQLHEPHVVGAVPTDRLESSRFGYGETSGKYAGMCFDEYVKSIDTHPNHSFDLVLVDGRARAACIERALCKIRAGGYLLLDNSNAFNNVDAVRMMQSYPGEDFHGVAPGWPPGRWTTSVWQMPG